MDPDAEKRDPSERPVGFQSWRELLFLHWPVEPDLLRPLLPRFVTLDLYDGRAYVGVIPFVIPKATAPRLPESFGLSFFETNVRTYVTIKGRDPGVYFFSLDAASLLAVIGARAGFGLPYFYARINSMRERRSVHYSLRRVALRSPKLVVSYSVGEDGDVSSPGSLQHFLLERYLLHVERASVLWTVQVRHAPYPIRSATVSLVQDELIEAAGIPEPREPPALVHYSPGVDVEIYRPRRAQV